MVCHGNVNVIVNAGDGANKAEPRLNPAAGVDFSANGGGPPAAMVAQLLRHSSVTHSRLAAARASAIEEFE